MTHDRTKHLGGSDAAAVMGLSPWATPMQVWRLKTGRTVDSIDAKRAKIFRRGHLLEPVILEMGSDRLQEMGLEVEPVCRNERYHDPEHPFLSVEIDAEFILTGEVEINGTRVVFDREPVNCDAKSVHGFASKKWGAEDTEDLPIEYAAQFMTGLMVRGRRYCVVFAMLGMDHVGIYWVVRDDATIAAMRAKLVSFWFDHVLADVPPDPIAYDDITCIFPMDDGQSVEATPEIAQKVAKLASVRSSLTVLKAQEEFLKFDIADFISPHAVLTYKGKKIASWKGQPNTHWLADELANDHPELVHRYRETNTVRVLRVIKEKS